MHKVFTFTLLFLMGLFAKAQTTTLLSESFEGSANGWQQQAGSGCTDQWGLTTATASSGSYSMVYICNTNGCASIVISPTITYANYKSTVTFTFDMYRSTADAASQDYMNFSILDQSYNIIQGYTQFRYYAAQPVESTGGWHTYSVTLPVSTIDPSNNGNFSIAFTAVSKGNGDFIAFDNVKVVENTPSNDFAFTSPSGSPTYYWGQPVKVNWTSTSNNNIDFKMMQSGGGNSVISWTSNSADHQHTIIMPMTSYPSFYITATDQTTGQTWNTPGFALAKPSINFTSPSTGETFLNGNAVSINWTSTGIGDINPNARINLQLMDSSGTFIQWIAKNVAYNANSYNWIVPHIYGHDYSVQAVFNDSTINQYLTYSSNKFVLMHNTGLADNAHNATFSLYPNPSNGSFTIELNQPATEKGILQVYGIDGREILQQSVNKGDKLLHISLGNALPQGLYTVYLRSGESIMHNQVMLVPAR